MARRWNEVKAEVGRQFINEKIHWLKGYITGLNTVINEFDLNWATEGEQILARMRSLVDKAQETLQALKKIEDSTERKES